MEKGVDSLTTLDRATLPEAHTATIRGVLVDVDGTLVDTNDAHALSWVDAFAENGRRVDYDEIRSLIGMGSDQMLPRVVGIEKDTEEGKRLSDAWSRIFREKHLPFAQPFPQAAELLQRFHQNGLQIVAATSGEEDIAESLLERAGATPFLSGKTTSADAKRSKPAPDIIAAALKKCGVLAEQAILLGDTPFDIEAGLSYGVAVVALRSGGFPDSALSGAIAIYDDPADLLAHFDESPFAAVS